MFVPERVFFQKAALEYSLGQDLLSVFRRRFIETHVMESGRPRTLPKGLGSQGEYVFAKHSLVVAVRKSLEFQTCKPSANYQLPIVTSCPGLCEYCYLQTTLGPRPFVTAYVNLDEIFRRARFHIGERRPETTVFEAGAAGDPVPTERYTGALAKAIGFFANEELGRLRVATKFNDISSLLALEHKGKTHFRFSVNAPGIIERFERGTPPLSSRIDAAKRMAQARYPIGFIIAPIFDFPGWKAQYRELAELIQKEMKEVKDLSLSLEFISHRFTARAKSTILSRVPKSKLPMDEQERSMRKGQFGYFKFLYPRSVLDEMKNEVISSFKERLPSSVIEYFV